MDPDNKWSAYHGNATGGMIGDVGRVHVHIAHGWIPNADRSNLVMVGHRRGGRLGAPVACRPTAFVVVQRECECA